MSELVGRFLSFEEQMGRGLVRFVYYVLIFLLVVTTLYDLVTTFFDIFGGKFWHNLGQFLVVIPLRFFVLLLLLRVGAELVMAVLSIDDNLRSEGEEGDTMSSGLSPVTVPPAQPAATPTTAAPDTPPTPAAEDGEPAPSTKRSTKRRPARKATRKTTRKAASSEAAQAEEPPKDDSGEDGPAS